MAGRRPAVCRSALQLRRGSQAAEQPAERAPPSQRVRTVPDDPISSSPRVTTQRDAATTAPSCKAKRRTVGLNCAWAHHPNCRPKLIHGIRILVRRDQRQYVTHRKMPTARQLSDSRDGDYFI